MRYAEIIMACICDYAGQVRGKGFPYSDLPKRVKGGIGLAPTNLMINAFGDTVSTPWGARGELLIMPDTEAEVCVDFGGALPDERFIIGSLHDLDGARWACCPRSWLQRGLEVLEAEFGLRVNAAFEHEFHYSGAKARLGDAYSLDSMRLQGSFAQSLMQALIDNDIEPEMIMPEFGPQQFEVTCAPAVGMKAADRAVCLREITRAVARAHDAKATFSPVMDFGLVGNGVHVHYSLLDSRGQPATYDRDGASGLSAAAARFTAGILDAMPSIVALTAPSALSYERLKPNRWSACFNNLADNDREAGVRICPVAGKSDVARSFNLEYRAADATASPYLTLGALVWAGIDGLRERRLPSAPTATPPEKMSGRERHAVGLQALPSSLSCALDLFENNPKLRAWMGEEFHAAYLMLKRDEDSYVSALVPAEQVRQYAETY